MPKILVIDDKQDNLLSTASLLNNNIPDCLVLTALSGSEGIEKAKAEQPDNILLDIHMPGMDGFETCRILKSDEATKHIPVTMVTAVRTDSASRVKGLELGADAFVTKPIDKSELTAQVKVMLRIKKSDDILRKSKDEIEHRVAELTKELKCLYGISTLANSPDVSLEELLQRTVGLIPAAWQYPDVTCARITIGDQEYRTKNFRETSWKQRSDISVYEESIGNLEVYCLENMPVLDGGPFLKEERDLIDAIAERVGKFIEHKRTEETQLRLLTAIEHADETIIITDKVGNVQYVNPASESITGYTLDDFSGQNISILRSDKHDEAFYKEIWDTISQGNVWKGQFINKKRAGGLYNVATTISPIRNPHGEITGFVNIMRDVTKELETEEQLRQAQKMEAIGTLSSGIAHDFNNILGGINLSAQLARKQIPEDHPANEDLADVEKLVMRAAGVVQQLLAFSRQDGTKSSPLELSPLVKESLKLLRSSVPASIEILSEIDNQCGTVQANPSQMHQVLMNLITNAQHAIEHHRKTGRIEVSLKPSGPDEVAADGNISPFIKLVVSDTGCGMNHEVIERIFDPFYTTKKVGKGTGLGLSVVHGIIKALGGSITVQSELGSGSTFTILLPVVIEEAPRVADTQEAPEPQAENEHILIVDDEEPMARALKRTLEIQGYRVTALTSSIEALETFSKDPGQYDLVITDLTMPKITGDDLAQELHKVRPDIPVVLMTGYGSETFDDERKRKLGIKAVLKKPVPQAVLTKTIHSALEGGRPGEQPTGRLLVIDDDDDFRRLLCKLLRQSGYEVIEAQDGKEGIKFFNDNRVDLVITDIVMPEKEGIETIMEMRKASRDIKIIAISGGGRHQPEDYLQIAKSLGAEYTFAKPFDQDDLLVAVSELLKGE